MTETRQWIAEGKLYLFVGIDRTSTFAVTQLVEKARLGVPAAHAQGRAMASSSQSSRGTKTRSSPGRCVST
ncbi:hypothetical protein [uncultured Mameliella sp.]|uniref:hypothetical protein n=1 Tax=uncultured Mameliella sp. TaxID=1447087 RepID=UPI00261F9D4B|nr:hypothetical protein [uncultured Mameliella sp.]